MPGPKQVTTITMDDFGDGIDRRGGIITRSAKKFYELTNYLVNQGRKIFRRPPLLKYTGQIDTATTKGCRWLNGQIVTVAPAGATVAHTVSDITTVFFDPPEGSSTAHADWELLELVIFNEQVCALIRHRFPLSPACEYRNHLHVWDNTHPTYVVDPACPPSWSPAFPLQPFGEGRRGSYKDYRPRMAVIGERLAITTAGGDTAFSGVALPRVWNQLSPAEVLANGEMFYSIIDTRLTPQFTIPVPYLDLVTEKRYAAYVCEFLNSAGSWTQFTEVTGTPSATEYSIAPITNRWDATKPDETQLTIAPGALVVDGTPFRFRAIATPTTVVVSGLYLTAKLVSGQLTVEGGNAIGGVMSHEGKSYNFQTVQIPTLPTPSQKVNVVVPIPTAPVTIPTIIGADDTIAPLNGQQRYWSRIIASVVANGTENIQAGQVRVYRSKGTLPGGSYFIHTGYSASTERLSAPNVSGVAVGDTIRVGTATFTIAAIYTSTHYIEPYVAAKAGVIRVIPVSGVSSLVVGGNGQTVEGVIPVKNINGNTTLYPWFKVGFNGGYTYAIDGMTAITVGGTRMDGTTTRYTEQLFVGGTVEVNGEKRKVSSITSDTVAEVELPFSTAGTFIALSDTTYQYAADVGDTGNEWFATKEAAITFNGSGKDDAIVLGTSTKDNSGALPVALAAMDNRLLVQFPSVLQAWAVGPNVSDFRHLANMGMGAGVNSRPEPVLVDGYAGLPTVNGPRLFAPINNNKDYVEFIAVGDMLRGINLPDLTRAVWWPRLRCWFSCGSTGGTIYALAVHKDAKVLAWATITLPGVTAIDTMFVRDNVLTVQSGANLYYFDPDADGSTVRFRDANGAYTSKARWLYNDLGSPQRNKKLIRCEIVQTGKSTLSVHVNPRSLDPVQPPGADKVIGPAVRGVTVGLQRFPVMAMGPGIALELESDDETGHELDSVGFDYILLNR